MRIIQVANLALRFLLGLCALAALGYWGYHTGTGTLMKVALCVGAVLLGVVVWGIFGAPASSRRLSDPWRLGLEILLFGGSALALGLAGQTTLAWVFGLALLINRVLIYVWEQ